MYHFQPREKNQLEKRLRGSPGENHFWLVGVERSPERDPMRQILEIEEHVAVPPMMYADPFYRITYLIKEEIRKYKWIEGEKGRPLSWPEARAEWTKAHREQYEKFLVETLSFPNLVPTTPFAKEANLSTEEAVARIGAALSTPPHRSQ